MFASVKELDTLGQRLDSLDSTEAARIPVAAHTHTHTHTHMLVFVVYGDSP